MPGWPVHDLRALAWIETAESGGLRFYGVPTVVDRESVTVSRNDPERVELRARLKQAGLVVLADPFYPGRRLTIDGRPAPIFRANRKMRGECSPGRSRSH